MFEIFGFGQAAAHLIPKEEKKKELLDREIFSATEALQMGIDAREKKRNDNRREVFRNIKYQINAGATKINLALASFADGNDIYFEGLGYKVRQVWYHPVTGLESFEEPVVDEAAIQQPQFQSGWSSTGGGMTFRSYVPQTYMQISWEK